MVEAAYEEDTGKPFWSCSAERFILQLSVVVFLRQRIGFI